MWKFGCCLTLLLAIPAFAHEIGTTRVTAVFAPGGNYEIEIVTDPAALAEKLGVPEPSLQNMTQRFLGRVKIAFDDSEVTPAVAWPPAGAPIRLTGAMPQGAHRFTWNFGWTFASYALTVHEGTAAPATVWLEGGQTSSPFQLRSAEPPISRLSIAWRYLRLGFTHIVPNGLDHMLFVLGIYLLCARPRAVLWQVSAFTVAHSITLGLSLYGVLTVSPKIVEPLIAVSIAYVAIENVFLSKLKPWRVALVFAFGLLHGMGFAGALKDLGLPRSEFVTALLTFNVGVETGQLTVIAAAFLLVGWQFGRREWYRSRIVVPASALIACAAVYWTVQRLMF